MSRATHGPRRMGSASTPVLALGCAAPKKTPRKSERQRITSRPQGHPLRRRPVSRRSPGAHTSRNLGEFEATEASVEDARVTRLIALGIDGLPAPALRGCTRDRVAIGQALLGRLGGAAKLVHAIPRGADVVSLAPAVPVQELAVLAVRPPAIALALRLESEVLEALARQRALAQSFAAALEDREVAAVAVGVVAETAAQSVEVRREEQFRPGDAQVCPLLQHINSVVGGISIVIAAVAVLPTRLRAHRDQHIEVLAPAIHRHPHA
mmetsp:Transcript_52326/g.159015  ORF Transcript_52326/g.159015 Transcript_52326/m.159015 type:complete len:266 (-) Transcript_52326:306-1103(-)